MKGTKNQFIKKKLLHLMALSVLATGAQADVFEEEVVVTAQKREENLSDVPIAITAFTGEQLDALGLDSSVELIDFTPGVSLAGDIGGQRAIFNIRGVVQNDYADIAEAPVAVYVDGGYLASTQAQTFGLFDIDRMEILKGPQGTLFGRNATGGLVNTITAKPTEEVEGYVSLNGGNFETRRFESAISGAIAENVNARLSVMHSRQGEILENIYVDGAAPDTRSGTVGGGGDGYNDDTTAGRLQFDFELSDTTNLLLSGNIADTTKSEGPYQYITTTEVKNAAGDVIDVIYAADDPLGCDTIQVGACVDGNFDGNPLRPVQGGDFNGNVDPDGSGNKVNKDFAFDDQNKIKSHGLMATLDSEFANFDFKSITDYKRFERTVGLDSDQTASPELIFQSNSDIDQYSQEFLFSGSEDKFDWVAGFYYLGVDTAYSQGLAASPTAGFLAGQENNTVAHLKTDSYSVFSQFDVPMNETVTLVLGGRLIRENKSLKGDVYQNANTDDRKIEIDRSAAPSETAEMDNDQNLWSGKAQLEFTPSDTELYYVGINRGVKAGSFNTPLLQGFSKYDPEVLLAYEAGTKLQFLDDKLKVNASVFYYDYSDYQSFSWVNNTGVIKNVDANFKGLELETFYSPTPSWDLMLGMSFIDATVEDLEVAPGVFRDTKPAFTPDFQASALVRYNWDVESGNIAAQLAGAYQTETFHNARNFTAHEIESRFKADARLTWDDHEGKWNVAAYVDNLTDSDHEMIGFDVSGFYGTTQMSYAKPRTYGVELTYNFF
jgi:iron complex outermembrane receptor protein